MPNDLQKAMKEIHATERLKSNTTAFLHGKIAKGKRRHHKTLRYAMACCAFFLVMLSGVGGYSAYAYPVSYISVEVNPSIELTLNRFDRVISVETYNDDGRLVMQNLDFKNRLYTDALEALLANEKFTSYLSTDSLLSFTVVSPKEENLLEGIRGCNGYTRYGGECQSADKNTVKEAHYSGLSVGRYGMYEELLKYDEAITVEECSQLSMRQLRDLLQEYSCTQEDGCNTGENRRGKGKNKRNGHHVE